MESNVIYETFIKGIKAIHSHQVNTEAWKVHTKSASDFVVDKDLDKAWDEVSYEYSKILHQISELIHMVETYKMYV